MARCKHENVDTLKPGDVFYPAYGTLGEFAVTCEQFRCIDCGAWLSLGQANDSIPTAELRLAEMLVEIWMLWEPGKSREEAIEIAVQDCAEWWP